jgi:hypothetical protein
MTRKNINVREYRKGQSKMDNPEGLVFVRNKYDIAILYVENKLKIVTTNACLKL